jgi:cytochrome c553
VGGCGCTTRMASPNALDDMVINPAPAPALCARWIGFAILIMLLMPGTAAVAVAQPTQRPPDTMEARLRACTPCHGRQGEGTSNN